MEFVIERFGSLVELLFKVEPDEETAHLRELSGKILKVLGNFSFVGIVIFYSYYLVLSLLSLVPGLAESVVYIVKEYPVLGIFLIGGVFAVLEGLLRIKHFIEGYQLLKFYLYVEAVYYVVGGEVATDRQTLFFQALATIRQFV